ncbi:sorting nexin mvp1 [Moniliophthora roreri MCA 2997]|uniref:Sorting nexin MVP1 n=1 Tax=Moniliophthora roreri (strain MCA 2997) TaxID=1381753 RepID=V2XV93_MONRO|nr:sorting nexin mvp1 [Moniliophthora roreri MCA 2997]KAI3619698.1 sorting nexin mvp1 [Moniliophthora roreri]
MFNSPRPAQRYGGNSVNGFGASFVDENPLAGSVVDGLDPWSAAPSPSATPAPQASSVFSSVIADATVPSIYDRAFVAVDPANTGETSVGSLSRVLATSGLPAATIDKIVNLVSSRSRVSKLEFFVALALVALAQSGKDVSIEQVAALSSQNELPEPALDLDALTSSTSAFTSNSNYNNSTIRTPAPSYSTDDPWTANTRFVSAPSNMSGFEGPGRSAMNNTIPPALAGTGLPKEWWKRQDNVTVTIQGQQGFILNRYTVYQITTDRGAPVIRRYSEFVYLWDCLVRRYPFRLFPALPPKRIGPDEYFLEQRRRGLARCLNFVINHPVIKEDGILSVFLTHPSFEDWRKQSHVSLDEESASKRVDRVEEMSIPSDLEDKITTIRRRLSPLIEQWQRICILAERIIKRREAAAVRINSPFRPKPAHILTPLFSFNPNLDTGTTSSDMNFSMFASAFGLAPIDDQSDLSRLTNTLRAVIEVTDPCWRADECELAAGIRIGLGHVATHCQRQSELSEQRTRALFDNTLEALKAQRDLYIATRDLFIRYDRLSLDQVERLKKRVETTSVKLDGIKATQKEGWQDEADKLSAAIEKDQATIAAQLSRRVFIRACLWSELRVVLHNRENTLLTAMIHQFAREEQEYAEMVTNNWSSLGEAVEEMPYE